jgi:hypothetical protein
MDATDRPIAIDDSPLICTQPHVQQAFGLFLAQSRYLNYRCPKRISWRGPEGPGVSRTRRDRPHMAKPPELIPKATKRVVADVRVDQTVDQDRDRRIPAQTSYGFEQVHGARPPKPPVIVGIAEAFIERGADEFE